MQGLVQARGITWKHVCSVVFPAHLPYGGDELVEQGSNSNLSHCALYSNT